MRPFRDAASRLQFVAIAFVSLVCLALIAVETANMWQERLAHAAEATRESANLARSLAQHAEDTVRTADVSIIGLVHRLELDGTSPDKLYQLSRITAARLAAVPALTNLVILDASGRCTAAPQALADAACVAAFGPGLEYHRVHNDDEPYLGNPVRDPADGAWVIPLSRRYDREDGSFGGIIVAAISAGYLETFYGSFTVGRQGAILLANVDGTVLVRRPLLEANIGRNLRDSPLFRDYLSTQRAGSIESRSPADGILRLNSFKRADEYPLVVGVALSKDEVLARWRADLRLRLARTGALVLLIAGLGAWLALQIRTRQRLEDAYRESAAAFRLLAENSTDLIVRVGPDMRRLYVSPAARELLGYEPEELLYRSTEDIVYPDDREIWQQSFAAGAVDPRQDARAVYRVRRKDGATIWVEVTRRQLASGDGFVMATRDVTSRKRAEDQLARANQRLQVMAIQDGLTGLANRRRFDESLETEFRRARRNGASLSLLMIDVDCFKAYNDFYGHPAGDHCLRELSRKLKALAARPGDLTARYGGEEIAILLPETSAEGAARFAERARAAVAALALPHRGNLAGDTVTVSIGVATLTRAAPFAGSADLVEAADRALYAAKQAGRNRVCLAEEPAPLRQTA